MSDDKYEQYVPEGKCIVNDPDYGEILVNKTTNSQSKCPKCGAGIDADCGEIIRYFDCGSSDRFKDQSDFMQTLRCKLNCSERDLTVERARVADLERQLAEVTAERDRLNEYIQACEYNPYPARRKDSD